MFAAHSLCRLKTVPLFIRLVGWAERSESHHALIGNRLVGLAALGPPYISHPPRATFVQHRLILPKAAGFIAIFLGVNLATAVSQDPFPSVPPGGYPFNSQGPNGALSRRRLPAFDAIPAHGADPAGCVPRGPPQESTGQPNPVAPPAYGPLYQAGQPPLGGGAMPTAYLSQPRLPDGKRPHIPIAPAKLCEWSQILGRVGNDVVLTGDVLIGIDDMMARAKGRIPPEKFAEQRALVVEQVTAGVKEFNAHSSDPDPVKAMTPANAVLIHQLLRQQIDVKMIYQDFLKTVPKEHLADIQENIDRHFDETQLKTLMKRENVVSRADLETALRAKGSSLDREKRIFSEQVVAQQWIQQKLKKDKDEEKEEEITHEEMLAWYQAHLKNFEHPAKARWEELMIAFARHPNRGEAYSAMAALGNRVLAGVSLADVARSASEGPTARDGGQRDWTQKDSLSAEALNQALFSQPVGQLSPQILESAEGFHIIRVVERKEMSRTNFSDVQKEIKESIKKEHFEKHTRSTWTS